MNEPSVRLGLHLLEVPVVLDLPAPLAARMRTALHALGPSRDEPDRAATATVRLRRDGPAGSAWRACADPAVAGDAPHSGDDPLGVAVTALTEVAVHYTPLLGMHAGVVCAPDGIVVLPGPSRLGKSTLVACALRAGFGYLSDEVLAVDRTTGQVTGLTRPLALDAIGWELAGLPAHECPEGDAERLVCPETLGTVGCPGAVGDVVDIVLARRADDGPTRLASASPGEAVAALLRHSFNHYRDPAASFARVVALARTARVWQANYSDARDLAATLAARLVA